jgi:hypothetical protein
VVGGLREGAVRCRAGFLGCTIHLSWSSQLTARCCALNPFRGWAMTKSCTVNPRISGSDVPASDRVPIPVRYRGDTVREIGPKANQQTFVGLERKSDRPTDRIVEQFVER